MLEDVEHLWRLESQGVCVSPANGKVKLYCRMARAIMLTQVTLAKPLITLLSKDWHKHQVIQRPNVIQASAAQPLPLAARPEQCC
jgi:hypothetical protein